LSDLRQRIAILPPEERAALERRLKEKALSVAEESIGRRSGAGPAPLSFAQERLWVLDRINPDSSFYSIPHAYRLRGPLDVEALSRAFAAVEQRHEVLRAVFPMEGGRPVQGIGAPRREGLSAVDLEAMEERVREGEVRRLLQEEAGRPFDLSLGPLVRRKVFRLGSEDHVLVVTIHHIVFDGWSSGIFWREVEALYEAYREGRASPLPELAIQYGDYAVWQRERLSGEVLEKEVAYWKGKLLGAPAVLELPGSRVRPSRRSDRGATARMEVSGPVVEALRLLGREEGATLFMTLLAAFGVLLMRHSGQEDVVVGTPVAGRNRSDIEGLIGFFVNTLVLRTDLSGEPTFRELLARVRDVALEAYAHQELPFEKLVEQVNPERTLSYSPIFQVMAVMQNAGERQIRLPGITVAPIELETTTSKFDLTAFFTETGRGMEVSFQYSTDVYEASAMERMLTHLGILLNGIAEGPDRKVWQLPLLTQEERHLVLEEWNRTEAPYPREKTVHRLFEDQVERTPEAVAVEMEGEGLSYGQLNERSNRLARHLQGRGVGPEVLVGLCVERSVEMVVGLLGILKAGGAYLPLDPGYPKERLRFLVEDGGPRLVLTHRNLGERLPEGVEQIRLDADLGQIERQSGSNPPSRATPDNLAYVIYTSGSTGKPKGVRIPHRGVVRLVCGAKYAELGPGEVFLQFAPLSFDASTFEIWGALANGARLVVMPPGIASPSELGVAIERHAVTTLWLTAGLFHQMVEMQIESLRGVRQLIAGGDVLSVAHVEKALRELPDCRLINGYGPTEGTTFTCCHTLSRAAALRSSVPIGRPIANTRVFILDSHRQPVPIGVTGELCIGGDGLARDYLGAAELTTEKFVPDPFGGPGDRLYRSGDRVRYRDDGTIEFLGRMDDQVKVRGFRVEPGEVEAALLRDPSLREASVVLREDSPGERRLVAYVSGEAAADEGVPQLRARLKQSLPDFMIPSAFVFLDALPLTANGKVDRAALPAPGRERPRLEKESVAARNTLESRLVAIWERVLGVRPIGVTDNFFDLGGHSLLAARLFSEIERDLGRPLALSTIFRAQTIAELAEMLEGGARRPSPSLVAIQPKGSRPPFFCVHAVWGNVFHYRELARRLGRDQPMYGLQARGLDGKSPPCEVVEEMAASYIEELRAFQPEGPYLLGGHSFGGLVAYEMARQLHARGQRVSLLALFDTSSSSIKSGRTPLEFVRGRARFHTANLKKIPPRGRAPYVLRRAGALAVLAGRSLSRAHERIFKPVRAARQRVYEANRRAASRYVPGPYPGRVTLLWAADRWRRLNDGRPPADRELGWGKLCGEGVDVREVPGDHASMLEDVENVQALAEVLSDCLRQAQEER
jgi:aspartate racemase